MEEIFSEAAIMGLLLDANLGRGYGNQMTEPKQETHLIQPLKER